VELRIANSLSREKCNEVATNEKGAKVKCEV
jgi:hypothetical protein